MRSFFLPAWLEWGASQVVQWWRSWLPVQENTGDLGLIPRSGRSPGGGNGNPLQYSCLENPMDRGAWRSMLWQKQRVAKSQTQLNDWAHTHTHGILVPQPGIIPTPPVLKGKVLTTGPPGKTLSHFFWGSRVLEWLRRWLDQGPSGDRSQAADGR